MVWCTIKKLYSIGYIITCNIESIFHWKFCNHLKSIRFDASSFWSRFHKSGLVIFMIWGYKSFILSLKCDTIVFAKWIPRISRPGSSRFHFFQYFIAHIFYTDDFVAQWQMFLTNPKNRFLKYLPQFSKCWRTMSKLNLIFFCQIFRVHSCYT